MLATPQSAALYDSVTKELNALLAHYKTLAKDGMTFAEIWELANNAINSATRIVAEAKQEFGDADMVDAILHFAEELYDQVIAPIDLPKVPNLIETRFVDPAIKYLYMQLITGAIKSIVNLLNRKAPTAPVAPTPDVPATPDAPAGFIPY